MPEDPIGVGGLVASLEADPAGHVAQHFVMVPGRQGIGRLPTDVLQQLGVAEQVDVQRALVRQEPEAVEIAADLLDFTQHVRGVIPLVHVRHDGESAELELLPVEERLAQTPGALQRHDQRVVRLDGQGLHQLLADDGQRVNPRQRHLVLRDLPDPGGQQIRPDQGREQHPVVAPTLGLAPLHDGVAIGGVAEEPV
jgi:hypothetical protein